MIDLYFAPTPNGQKISIMLEECGLPYRLIKVDLAQGDQFKPTFLTINPNSKIPAIVDQDGPDGKPYTVFESGAILLYLAEKTGRFMPSDMRKRYEVIQWVMFQMAGLGPMWGQAFHFRNYAPEKIPYAINRYSKEAKRLLQVLETQLTQHDYLAADEYTVADMATFPWVATRKGLDVQLEDYPHVQQWFDRLKTRPSLRKGFTLFRDTIPEFKTLDDAAKELLYGIKK